LRQDVQAQGDAAKPESRRRCASGPGSSEHPHLGLGTEHPLLIGSQDQCLLAGHVVRLGADMPLAIEEQHPQQLAGGNRCAEAGGYEEMHRDDADRAGAAEGSGGHGWAGERHRRSAPAPPAPRKGRRATRVSPCAVRKPGQAGWRDRQIPGASTSSAKPFPRVASTSRFLADHPREAHHHWRLIGPELLGRGLQEGHQDRDQQDVVPQGGLQGAVG